MEIILAALSITFISFIGIFFVGKSGRIIGTHRFIIPFAIGAFLAITFFELIPETLAASEVYGAIAIVSGFLLFYLLSNILHTYHHHHDDDEHGDNCGTSKVSAMMLMWGDAVHNLTDGIVIASAFFINPTVGVMTTVGIALHEIPQEIAEYGVLIKAGYSPKKALFLNFISALGIVVGAGLSLLFVEFFLEYMWVLTGVAAGNLLYIAASDLLPEVHTQSHKNGSFIVPFCATLFGVALVGSMIEVTHVLFEHPDEHTHAYVEDVPEVTQLGSVEDRIKAFEDELSGQHRHGDGPYHTD